MLRQEEEICEELNAKCHSELTVEDTVPLTVTRRAGEESRESRETERKDTKKFMKYLL